MEQEIELAIMVLLRGKPLSKTIRSRTMDQNGSGVLNIKKRINMMESTWPHLITMPNDSRKYKLVRNV
eukprot:5622652-Ditylum_brightwellii.AAC.1